MPYLSHIDFAKVHDALLRANSRLDWDSEDATALEVAAKLCADAVAAVANPGLREEAHDQYGSDEIEIDDEGVGTSEGEGEGGVWVQAWVWIEQDEDDDDEDTTVPEAPAP